MTRLGEALRRANEAERSGAVPNEPTSINPARGARDPRRPPGAPALMPASGAAEKLVGSEELSAAAVEQYRKLAAMLLHSRAEQPRKVVMVSSAVAGEGKSLTSANLALTLSKSYKWRVLLIDADLRRPTLHTVLGVPNESGLADALRLRPSEKLPLRQISSHLWLLTAGRLDADPMSSLVSERMRRLVRETAALFDWVIVDTPPVGLLPDANLLASMVDGALLVAAAGRTPHGLIKRAVDALGRNRIIGVVLNQVEENTMAGGYGHNYYYGKPGRQAGP
jgi:capsular exopolysaccharide synthesis family protein